MDKAVSEGKARIVWQECSVEKALEMVEKDEHWSNWREPWVEKPSEVETTQTTHKVP